MIPAIITVTAAAYWLDAFGVEGFVVIKYLLMALAFTGWLIDCRRGLLYRSVIAVFAIACWFDFIGYWMWMQWGWSFDTAYPLAGGMFVWLWFVVRRAYDHPGAIQDGHIHIMLLRPCSPLAVCKALVGFPTASVCICARGNIWSFRAKTGTFDVYPVTDAWLRRHIAINTGVQCSDDLQQMLDNLCGQPRFPGTKCVWAIRGFLKKLGPEYAPRWCDYIPGIYAMRLLRKGV